VEQKTLKIQRLQLHDSTDAVSVSFLEPREMFNFRSKTVGLSRKCSLSRMQTANEQCANTVRTTSERGRNDMDYERVAGVVDVDNERTRGERRSISARTMD
jgi:hypothetical protein